MKIIISKNHPDRFWLILSKNEYFDSLPSPLTVYKVWGKEDGAEVCLPAQYINIVIDRADDVLEYIPGMNWRFGGRYEEMTKEEALQILSPD